MLTAIAVESPNKRTGTIKVSAKNSLDKKVTNVDFQISFAVCLSSASSDICIPSASESASAIAIMRMPLMITEVEWVLECKPTIIPRVVIIPDVMPKPNPFLIASLAERFIAIAK